jgi:D-alanyl-lipoteichoic acid acyltransferase DltB (MBOAT superfamily)
VSQASLLYVAAILALWVTARLSASRPIRLWLYVVASWLFYFSLDARFLPLLLLSSVFNYHFGGLIRKQPRLGFLWAGALANVALLAVFKYLPAVGPFFPHNPFWQHVAAIALPLGVSFWTFQALSYLFDQYRGDETRPTLGEFCLYMGFAPTVMSGPICRVSGLVPQFRTPFAGSWESVREGAQGVWVGVGMITLARMLAAGHGGFGVDEAFASRGALGTADAWVMLLGYGFQIYFDFAGYSRLVIGVARMFGFQLPENFDRPYLSTSVTSFWQRWHMSLSFWIRDYVFMPLAMSRRELWWRHASLVISMAVFGLWHSASWLFLLWGVYQGLMMAAHRLWQQFRRGAAPIGPRWLRGAASWLLTFAVIILSWTLFRADGVSHAMDILKAALIPAPGLHLPSGFVWLVLGLTVGYFVSQLAVRRVEQRTPDLLSWLPMPARFACYAAIFYLAVFRAAEAQGFIYTQF